MDALYREIGGVIEARVLPIKMQTPEGRSRKERMFMHVHATVRADLPSSMRDDSLGIRGLEVILGFQTWRHQR